MKNLLSIAALGLVFVAANAKAANLSVIPNGDIYSIYLDSAGTDFDSIELTATPDATSTFVNANSGLASGVPRPAGQAFTYINRQLNGDPLDDPANLGWSILGLTNNSTILTFSGGPLGQKIQTTGPLFLANVNLSSSGKGSVAVKLVNVGVDVGAPLTAPLGIPEPATFVLGGLGILGLAAVRRRIG